MRRHIFLISILASMIVLGIFMLGCSAQSTPTGEITRESVTQTAAKPVQKYQNIEIKGSDTLLQLVSNMAEAYSEDNSYTRISVTGGGSGTGIAALINGEIDIADASRGIKDSEIRLAMDNGILPWEFIIARDMLSVIVHENNPVEELTMEQIGKIFKGEITNWAQVGGPLQVITLYGRQSTSGTYAFFMEHVVQDDYSPKMRNLEGNQAILDAVTRDKTGIGYVGIGYLVDSNGNQVDGINVIKVAQDKNSEYISLLDTEQMADYSISRPLYQYFAGKPEHGSETYAFLKFELSNEGQRIVEKSGFVEITPKDRKHNDDLFAKI